MLAKFLAVWIVLLAASPFTHPFTTVSVDLLYGERPEPKPGLWSVSSASIHAVDLKPAPGNLPVEVHQTPDSWAHPSLATASHPGALSTVRAAAASWHDLNAQLDRTRGPCPFAVLRL